MWEAVRRFLTSPLARKLAVAVLTVIVESIGRSGAERKR